MTRIYCTVAVITICIATSSCAWNRKTRNAINDGYIRLGAKNEDVVKVLGPGQFFKTEKLESGDILEVRLYRDWAWVYSTFAEKYYWVGYVNGVVTGYGVAGKSRNIHCTTTYTGSTASTSCY